MNDLHIHDFCKDTAKIFVQLYRQFPIKSILYVEDICGPDTPDEFGLHAPRFQAGFSTVIWLAEANYLYYSSTIQQEAFESTCLSQPAFTFLASIDDDSIVNNQPITRIEKIRDTLQHKSSDKLKTLILDYLKQAKCTL